MFRLNNKPVRKTKTTIAKLRKESGKYMVSPTLLSLQTTQTLIKPQIQRTDAKSRYIKLAEKAHVAQWEAHKDHIYSSPTKKKGGVKGAAGPNAADGGDGDDGAVPKKMRGTETAVGSEAVDGDGVVDTEGASTKKKRSMENVVDSDAKDDDGFAEADGVGEEEVVAPKKTAHATKATPAAPEKTHRATKKGTATAPKKTTRATKGTATAPKKVKDGGVKKPQGRVGTKAGSAGETGGSRRSGRSQPQRKTAADVSKPAKRFDEMPQSGDVED